MTAVAAAAAAILASPGLGRLVAMATARRPDPRLLTAAAFGVSLLIAWCATGPLHAGALAVTAAVGIVAGWTDAYCRRLPDVLVLSAYPVLATLLIATVDPVTMLRAAACASLGLGLYAVGWAFGQVGFGDVKLAGLLGMAVGWSSWSAAAFALVAAAVLAGAQAMIVIVLRRRDFPLGPAMLLGAAAALAAQNMDIIH